jgi:hypothetical protein
MRSMGCRGVHFALDEADAARIGALTSDASLLEFIQEEIEERWDEEWLEQTDKAWDAIHRTLTDGTLSVEPATVLHKCILGGRHLYSGDDYIASYLSPKEVADVARAIAPLSKSWFRERYFSIAPDDYGSRVDEEDFEYTWSYFEPLKAFFAKAAAAGRVVVFTVGQ